LTELRKEKFNLRFQRATGQLANTARANHVRKEIAKILTIMGERTRGAKAPAAKAKKSAAKKSAA
jgi:large subunit ribosomal protein L29